MAGDPIATDGALVALLASLAQAFRETDELGKHMRDDPTIVRDRIRYLVQQAEVTATGQPLTARDVRVLRRLHALFEMLLDRGDLMVDPRTIREN